MYLYILRDVMFLGDREVNNYQMVVAERWLNKKKAKIEIGVSYNVGRQYKHL